MVTFAWKKKHSVEKSVITQIYNRYVSNTTTLILECNTYLHYGIKYCKILIGKFTVIKKTRGILFHQCHSGHLLHYVKSFWFLVI